MKLMLSIFGIFALLFSCSFMNIGTKSVIVIDAAHGGIDNGATIADITEKEITLSIAQKIKSLNPNDNTEVVLIREKDEFQSLQEKAKKINDLRPTLIISLHTSYSVSNASKSGFEIIVSEQNKQYASSVTLANQLMHSLMRNTGTEKSILNRNLYVLRSVDCPAIALELGYLSNEKDRNYLLSESGQNEVAQSILSFINK